jgi:hypothetical protein
MKLSNIKISTSASGRGVIGHLDYQPPIYTTQIEFQTDRMILLYDPDLLQYALEQFLETQYLISNSQSPKFIKIK